jgi:hypothetical protein
MTSKKYEEGEGCGRLNEEEGNKKRIETGGETDEGISLYMKEDRNRKKLRK